MIDSDTPLLEGVTKRIIKPGSKANSHGGLHTVSFVKVKLLSPIQEKGIAGNGQRGK